MSEFQQRLTAANVRIQLGADEQAAGADDKARAIAAEVERLATANPEDGVTAAVHAVAAEQGVHPNIVWRARTRAANVSPTQRLPGDTLERLLEASFETLPPLTEVQCQALTYMVRSTIIDAIYITQPGPCLAGDVEDSELLDADELTRLANLCRGLDPWQGAALINACQRNELKATAQEADGEQDDEEEGEIVPLATAEDLRELLSASDGEPVLYLKAVPDDEECEWELAVQPKASVDQHAVVATRESIRKLLGDNPSDEEFSQATQQLQEHLEDVLEALEIAARNSAR